MNKSQFESRKNKHALFNIFILNCRIIQDFQLNSSKIYCIVAKQLAQNYNCNDIEKLVDCIATSGMSEESTSVVCDEVISLSIRTMCTDNMGASCSMTQIESLIKLIHDVNIKVSIIFQFNCNITLRTLRSYLKIINRLIFLFVDNRIY